MKRSRRTTRTYYASIPKLRIRSAKKTRNGVDNESSISSDNSLEHIDNTDEESIASTESISYDNISEHIDNTDEENIASTESVSYDNISEHIDNTESVVSAIEEEQEAESSNSHISPGILINEVN